MQAANDAADETTKFMHAKTNDALNEANEASKKLKASLEKGVALVKDQVAEKVKQIQDDVIDGAQKAVAAATKAIEDAPKKLAEVGKDLVLAAKETGEKAKEDLEKAAELVGKVVVGAKLVGKLTVGVTKLALMPVKNLGEAATEAANKVAGNAVGAKGAMAEAEANAGKEAAETLGENANNAAGASDAIKDQVDDAVEDAKRVAERTVKVVDEAKNKLDNDAKQALEKTKQAADDSVLKFKEMVGAVVAPKAVQLDEYVQAITIADEFKAVQKKVMGEMADELVKEAKKNGISAFQDTTPFDRAIEAVLKVIQKLEPLAAKTKELTDSALETGLKEAEKVANAALKHADRVMDAAAEEHQKVMDAASELATATAGGAKKIGVVAGKVIGEVAGNAADGFGDAKNKLNKGFDDVSAAADKISKVVGGDDATKATLELADKVVGGVVGGETAQWCGGYYGNGQNYNGWCDPTFVPKVGDKWRGKDYRQTIVTPAGQLFARARAFMGPMGFGWDMEEQKRSGTWKFGFVKWSKGSNKPGGEGEVGRVMGASKILAATSVETADKYTKDARETVARQVKWFIKEKDKTTTSGGRWMGDVPKKTLDYYHKGDWDAAVKAKKVEGTWEPNKYGQGGANLPNHIRSCMRMIANNAENYINTFTMYGKLGGLRPKHVPLKGHAITIDKAVKKAIDDAVVVANALLNKASSVAQDIAKKDIAIAKDMTAVIATFDAAVNNAKNEVVNVAKTYKKPEVTITTTTTPKPSTQDTTKPAVPVLTGAAAPVLTGAATPVITGATTKPSTQGTTTKPSTDTEQDTTKPDTVKTTKPDPNCDDDKKKLKDALANIGDSASIATNDANCAKQEEAARSEFADAEQRAKGLIDAATKKSVAAHAVRVAKVDAAFKGAVDAAKLAHAAVDKAAETAGAAAEESKSKFNAADGLRVGVVAEVTTLRTAANLALNATREADAASLRDAMDDAAALHKSTIEVAGVGRNRSLTVCAKYFAERMQKSNQAAEKIDQLASLAAKLRECHTNNKGTSLLEIGNGARLRRATSRAAMRECQEIGARMMRFRSMNRNLTDGISENSEGGLVDGIVGKIDSLNGALDQTRKDAGVAKGRCDGAAAFAFDGEQKMANNISDSATETAQQESQATLLNATTKHTAAMQILEAKDSASRAPWEAAKANYTAAQSALKGKKAAAVLAQQEYLDVTKAATEKKDAATKESHETKARAQKSAKTSADVIAATAKATLANELQVAKQACASMKAALNNEKVLVGKVRDALNYTPVTTMPVTTTPATTMPVTTTPVTTTPACGGAVGDNTCKCGDGTCACACMGDLPY